MIKVFTINKDGKIEFTKDELKKLLDEAYWDGYKANSNSWTYITPAWKPYVWCNTSGTTTVTLNSDQILNSDQTTCNSTTSCLSNSAKT